MLSNLILIMKHKGITQLQMAELLDVRPATISDKMTGKSKFYFDEALKVKLAFFPEYQLEYIFERDRDIA